MTVEGLTPDDPTIVTLAGRRCPRASMRSSHEPIQRANLAQTAALPARYVKSITARRRPY